jgi:hypothetical protein
MRYFIAILFLLPVICTNAQKNSRPNIIFIFADDLGYGDIGCYGQQKLRHQILISLHKRNEVYPILFWLHCLCAVKIKFSYRFAYRAYCYPRKCIISTEGQTPIPDSVITFANLLQQNGYATAAFGKWGLGYITTSGDPNKKGFDLFMVTIVKRLLIIIIPIIYGTIMIELISQLKTVFIPPDIIHQQALQYLKSTGDKPFFMYLPYTIPHGEVIVPHDSIYYYYIKKFNEQLVAAKRMYDGRPLGEYHMQVLQRW